MKSFFLCHLFTFEEWFIFKRAGTEGSSVKFGQEYKELKLSSNKNYFIAAEA